MGLSKDEESLLLLNCPHQHANIPEAILNRLIKYLLLCGLGHKKCFAEITPHDIEIYLPSSKPSQFLAVLSAFDPNN
jgi:hypothetical protein